MSADPVAEVLARVLSEHSAAIPMRPIGYVCQCRLKVDDQHVHIAVEMADALREAGLIPEATTRVELALRRPDGVVPGKATGSEEFLRNFISRHPQVTLVSRAVTTYADHVTEWEAVE